MTASGLAGLAEQLAETAAAVVASGAISANGHGNVSIRIPGSSEMLFSTAPTLRGLAADMVARVRLDGEILEGEVPPINKAVIDMHTTIYADQPEAGCVIHTHSPYGTAFAVARRPIDCWIEALAMFGLPDGVPVAAYGPRGSALASPISAPRCRLAGAPCCWRTTASWSSIAHPLRLCRSAASCRKPHKPPSTPWPSVARRRSSQICARLPFNER